MGDTTNSITPTGGAGSNNSRQAKDWPSFHGFPIWLNFKAAHVKEFREVFELKIESSNRMLPQGDEDAFAMEALFHSATEVTKQDSKIDFEFFKIVKNAYPDKKNPRPVSEALDRIERRYRSVQIKRKMDCISSICNFIQGTTSTEKHVEDWKELLIDAENAGFKPCSNNCKCYADFTYNRLLNSLRVDSKEKVLMNDSSEDMAKLEEIVKSIINVEAVNEKSTPKISDDFCCCCTQEPGQLQFEEGFGMSLLQEERTL